MTFWSAKIVRRMLRRTTIVSGLFMVLASAWVPSERAAAEEYLIQAGDLLVVTVWKEEDLSREVVVRPDGGISFPLAGDIPAAGMSVSQLTDAISAKIEEFIPEPVVTVSVRQALGNRIYVIGKVNSPGLLTPIAKIDVLQALSMAGGMNAFAELRKIKILRRVNGEQKVFFFDYRAIEKGENLEQNIVLQSGDVVVVP
ncbi:MAG: polysaccharide export protein [Gammaproteobacteria bacterium]|nr:polysaccharide export protein [Gammaproteobacteria bacterium]